MSAYDWFLVAAVLYPSFEPLRFLAFLAIPIALMLVTRLSYRGRVW
jgi:hypothetical protein